MLGKAVNLCGTNLLLLRRNVFTTSSGWQQKTTPGEDKRLNIMRSYLRYMNYYEQILEKRFPAAMKVYRIFKHGINNFYQDVKTFAKVKFEVEATTKEQAFSTLTRRDIEVYHQLPKDMMKIAPVLLVSALPMANFVVYPLAYMYPKTLLTSHFWTDQQKTDFNGSVLNERLKYSTPVFKCLQAQAKVIMHKNLIPKWSQILEILQDGKQPSVEQLVECKHLFVTGPYSIRNLHFVHSNNLLRLHGVPVFLSTPKKLVQRAYFLKETDNAIIREGGVKNMKDEDLKVACFIRGFDTTQLSHETVVDILEKWLSISTVVEKESYSLLLHSSLLLSYNLQKHSPKSS